MSNDENNEDFGFKTTTWSIDLLVESGSNMEKMENFSESDTYVYITLVGHKKCKKLRTGTINNNKDPQWNR